MKNLNLVRTLLFTLSTTALLCCTKSNSNPADDTTKKTDPNISSEDLIPGINKGLVAYYPFKGNLIDSSGNGHNGTIVGNISYTTDHLGNANSALRLGSGYVVTDNFFNFQRTDSFTVAMWFTLKGTNTSGRLISTECPEGNFRIGGGSNGIYAFQYGDDYVYDTVALNTWNHLVFVYNNRKIKLYKNGVLKYKGYDNSTEALHYCAPFTIGAKASSAYDEWQGKIEGLRVYNRPLSQSEVTQLFDTSQLNVSQGLIAYYPFNGNANDNSGNNNNGTVQNAKLTVDRFGNLNNAYSFDGFSSYITIPSNSQLNLIDNFSISSWFKMKAYATTYNASMIISKHDGDVGNDGFIYGILNPYHNNNQILIFGANGSVYPNPLTYVTTDKWYNYVVTYDKVNGLLNYYLNGVLASSQNSTINMLPNNLDVTIGYQKSTYGTYLDYFTGKIDDIRIYNRVLSNIEVRYLSSH